MCAGVEVKGREGGELKWIRGYHRSSNLEGAYVVSIEPSPSTITVLSCDLGVCRKSILA